MPWRFSERARLGYCGTTLLTTLRRTSEVSWAGAWLGANIRIDARTNIATAIRFFMGQLSVLRIRGM
jgi:hypothetical protein